MAGDAIDSILPMAEYVRRFRVGTEETAGLGGEIHSRDSLASRVLAATSQRDTVALSGLVVTRAEFAWLVFPEHNYAKPPYELDPALFWAQIQSSSNKGAGRLLGRYGGTQLSFQSLACTRDTLQTRSERLTMWSGCTVRFTSDGTDQETALFGTIVEHDGVMKLLGYGNEL